MIDLDCSSAEDAWRSVARLLQMRDGELCTRVQSLDFPYPDDLVEFCRNHFDGLAGAPISVAWFHGTRVIDPNDFRRYGILTKSQSRLRLAPKLRELALGLHKEGVYPNKSSAVAKARFNNEGPFAFLIAAVPRQPCRTTHDYTDAPELVEDIAGELLGGNYGELVSRFRQISLPCIVKFQTIEDDRREKLLARALWYLHLLAAGESEQDAAGRANTCNDLKGQPVPAFEVCSVEVLASDRSA